MSETAKVRLVRCPKCENLLPEVTDFSVYQCGGCGAVLRCKNKGVDLDTFSEKSTEEMVGSKVEKLSDRYEKMVNVSERRVMEMMSDGSESDVRSNVSSSSRAERRRARERAEIGRNGLGKEENWDVDGDVMRDRRFSEIQQVEMARDFEDPVLFRDNEAGLRRPGRVGERSDEMEGVWRAQRVDPGAGRRAKDGSFDHLSASSYDFDDPSRSRGNGVVDGLSNAEFVEDDRAELLRQLDELKYKLSLSGNLNDKGKEKAPLDRRMLSQDPYASENEAMMMQSSLKRPPFQNQYTEPPHLMRRQEMGENGFYPPRYGPSHVQGYGNPSRPHLRPSEAQGGFQMPPAHGYVSGPYVDDGVAYMDNMEPYPAEFSRHHPSCSCYHCRAKGPVSNPMMQAAYSGKYSNMLDDRGSFGARDHYNPRVHDQPPLRPRATQSHARWPSDVNSEVDGFTRRRPARAHLVGGGKHCSHLAGGAPLLTCNSCFEVLMLPKKAVSKNSSRKKLRCGACSSLIAFVVSGKKMVVSLDMEAKNGPPKADNARSVPSRPTTTNKRDVPSRRGDTNPSQTRTAFSSEDYDSSGYDFHSMDREVSRPGRDSKPIETRLRHSTSTYASDAEEEAQDFASAADIPREDKGPQPPTCSTLQDYFEQPYLDSNEFSDSHSNKHRVVKDSGEGNRSGRSERGLIDRSLPSKTGAKQILRKESTATEIDISSNEFSNTGSTFESSGASRGGRGAGSFFAGIMGSFKDPHRPEESASVTVNGHLIPDRLIKKAEKIAGPIQPGHYWYDYRAGFWGAIGGSCLGIIPPFIEEFNYPMPEHCADGNTQIYVNGRELNHKDLNLLVGRGLPREIDRSYIVEISGRVLDEDTGEELESLGKLAPTMERVKRGFGMKIPQAVA
ncbi:protein ENHANCED DISEASE RESISTANCE 4-like isoform X2 [Salvia splendens]|uniref:protein ENHANCED DISEASE RESISTANCE 4-like isoform X2 n=1 Tax=Salvia splendens TaxID=180675 RepID=UPI001C2773BB|nr:protein ENHANCED DISEASE RESISTANCE 4-like isoform X2 [Salvia splendens]